MKQALVRRIDRRGVLSTYMRHPSRSIIAVAILLISITVPSIGAEAGDLGFAGDIETLNGSTIGWADLGNGDVAIVNESGNITAIKLTGNEAGQVIWTGILNVTALSMAYSHADGLIAVGHQDGAVIYSTVFEAIIYSISRGPIDSLDFDPSGDLWVSDRASKRAYEYSDGVATGAETTSHTIGITSVEVTPQGDIVTGGRDRVVRVHSNDGSLLGVLSEPNAEVTAIMGDSDGKLHAVTKDGQYLVYESVNWSLTHSSTPSPPTELIGIFDTDADTISLAGSNGLFHIMNRTSGNQIQSLSNGNGEVMGILAGDSNSLVVLMSFASSSDVLLFDIDTDGDNVVDSLDAFPLDPSQTSDRDGDGYGDSQTGNQSDSFPDDSTQWEDADMDGYGDNPDGTNPDLFPSNPDQYQDSDSDGYGDSTYGQDGDSFPEDGTQWADTDGDGFGDNLEGTNPDACPDVSGSSTEDRLGCPDLDGDGWSDEGDSFASEPTQWMDSDGDGYGDAQQGFRGDGCANEAGTSTRYLLYNPVEDKVETVSSYGCPDSDGDGYADESEAYWDADNCPGSLVGNSTEWLDEDRDCLGSNTDYDDREFNVQTVEDHCERNVNDSICATLDKEEEVNQNLEVNQQQEADLASQLISFAPIGAAIAGIMLVVIGVLSIVGRKLGKKSETDEEKYTRRGATKEIETGSVEQIGGIIEDEKWDDDVASLLDLSETSPDEEIVDEDNESTEGKQRGPVDEPSNDESQEEPSEVDDGTGNWEAGQEGWQVYQNAEEGVTSEEPQATEESTSSPAEAPPLPEGGLPEGWTMDQWRWYGHEWLEKNS